jgi:Tfp pilus assembly protein PilV
MFKQQSPSVCAICNMYTREKNELRRVSQKGGYTLLETLIAIFILTLVIVGPMSVASRTLFSATIARQQVIAFYLAQEAIESIRNIRDQNSLSGSWLTDLPALGQNFTIDVTAINPGTNKPTMTLCAASCPPINYDLATHLYQYQTGTPSDFTRTVRIDSVPDKTDEVAVSVTIDWSVGKIPRSFTARENIFNWQ